MLSLILLAIILTGGCKSKDTTPVVLSPSGDITPPTIQSKIPDDGNTLVPTSDKIKITFNEEIDPASVNNVNISASFQQSGQVFSIPGDVTLTSPANREVFFAPSPTGTLFPDIKNITVKVQGVKDKNGNVMSSSVVWIFETASTPDTTNPVFPAGDPKLEVIPTSSNTMLLKWNAATDDSLLQYVICQSLTAFICGDSIPNQTNGIDITFVDQTITTVSLGQRQDTTIHTVSTLGATSFDVSGLVKNTPYFFAVRAIDVSTNKNISINTGEKQGTTLGDLAPVGTSLNNVQSLDATNPSIVFVGANTRYVAWEEGFLNGINSNVYIRKRDNTASVWSEASLQEGGSQPNVASDRSATPVAFLTYTKCEPLLGNPTPVQFKCKILVTQETGSTPMFWEPVGTELNINSSLTSTIKNAVGASAIAFDGSNIPYVVWTEETLTKPVRQIYVKQFVGTSPAWKELTATSTSLNVDSAKDAMNPAIAIDGTSIRVAWTECDDGSLINCKLYVKKWNPNATPPSWDLVGASFLNTDRNFPLTPSLTFGLSNQKSALHIAWNEGKTVFVKKEEAGGGFTSVEGVTLPLQSPDGVELWKSDGNGAGTILVKEISRMGSSSPSGFTEGSLAGTFFFQANDGIMGAELWKSDGSVAGTVLVKDINPDTAGSSPTGFTNVAGTIFFAADNGTSGVELWRSDGTDAGTIIVKDINSGAGSSSPSNLINGNGTLFFLADDGVSGVELWKSDGTDTGTIIVKDIITGTGSSSPSELTIVGTTLFFTVNDGVNGLELWRTDATSGAVLVKDINGTGGSSPSGLTNINGTLFFSADDGTDGVELWRSDGTDAGTLIVKEINIGTGSSSPSGFTEGDALGTFFFSANDGINGVEFWKSDGTDPGTSRLKNINPGAVSSSPTGFIKVGNTIYFSADDGTSGVELWKSDGTEAGTSLVQDINSGSASSSPSDLTNVSGMLFFTANDGTNGVELWKSNNTIGAVLVRDINPGTTAGSSLSGLTNVNGTLFFSADDGGMEEASSVLNTPLVGNPTSSQLFIILTNTKSPAGINFPNIFVKKWGMITPSGTDFNWSREGLKLNLTLGTGSLVNLQNSSIAFPSNGKTAIAWTERGSCSPTVCGSVAAGFPSIFHLFVR